MTTHFAATNPAAAAKQPYRRRRLIVSTLQWKYALSVGAIVFLVSSVLSCVLFASLHQEARMRMLHPASYTSNTATTILLCALGFAAVSAGAVGFWMVVMTHRICGPLYVFDGHFRKLAAGRLPYMRPLRRKDELKDLYRSFTCAVERVRDDRLADLAVVNKALVEAKGSFAMDDAACRRALDTVARELEGLRRTLSEALEMTDSNAAPSACARSPLNVEFGEPGNSAAPTPNKPSSVGVA